jgi:hypothetical protein
MWYPKYWSIFNLKCPPPLPLLLQDWRGVHTQSNDGGPTLSDCARMNWNSSFVTLLRPYQAQPLGTCKAMVPEAQTTHRHQAAIFLWRGTWQLVCSSESPRVRWMFWLILETHSLIPSYFITIWGSPSRASIFFKQTVHSTYVSKPILHTSYVFTQSLQPSNEVGNSIVSIGQMRIWGMKRFSNLHKVKQEWNQDSNPLLSLTHTKLSLPPHITSPPQ